MSKVSSLFSQLLKEIPRENFNLLVKEHKAEVHSKGFKSWTQLVSMLFCHLAKAESLRDICNGLSCCLGKLNHLGVSNAPNKSTLAYANEHRRSEVYKELFWDLINTFRTKGIGAGKKKKFKFKNKLLSLDASVITLCLNLFPWAKYRTIKGGVKLHVLLDHDDYMPEFVHITNANKSDVTVAKSLNIIPGSVVAMDRAYIDYKMFSDWTDKGVFFVTRLKSSTVYDVVTTETLNKDKNILSDQIIKLREQKKCKHELRKVEVYNTSKNETITLLTNNMDFSALTISDIYKDRWEIELFFKLIKQNLKIKTFVGTSFNALETQLWTALIALLLIKWMHFLSKTKWSFSNLFAMLRMSLFTHKALMEWIHNPFGKISQPPEFIQLELIT